MTRQGRLPLAFARAFDRRGRLRREQIKRSGRSRLAVLVDFYAEPAITSAEML